MPSDQRAVQKWELVDSEELDVFRSGFFHLDTVDILDGIVLCCGGLSYAL